MKTVEIFIVTYWKDNEWLAWCLKSIARFASGFSGITVVAPYRDKAVIAPRCEEYGATLKHFNEHEGRGMLHHMAINCMADQFVHSDFALHMDSDCIFTEPVTPDDYFVDGKPVLLKQAYEDFMISHPGAYYWKECTEHALKQSVLYETMRRHPAVHPMETYVATRRALEKAQGRPFIQWALDGKNEFPQFWSEFNLLGAVAHAELADQYHWIDVGKKPSPKNKLAQFWSHGGLDRPCDTQPFFGDTPRQVYERLLS
jgi:hypothetical protein